MIFDNPIIIQKINEDSEEWIDVWKLHASINKSKASEYNAAGVETRRTLTFTVRYARPLETIAYNMGLYRIVFGGVVFNINDFDDYMLSHQTIRFTAVSEYE
jgi:head-tail adaptor